MDMPPLTPPDKPLHPVFWRSLLVMACVLVFSFALHAKVAVYGQIRPQASTASKLWVNDIRPAAPIVVVLPLLVWLAVFLSIMVRWSDKESYCTRPVLAQERRRQQYLHRFLRPPPAL